jgi:hypothetical protein
MRAVPKSVSAYMAKIGAKGGARGLGVKKTRKVKTPKRAKKRNGS